jgi:hypothetical protein
MSSGDSPDLFDLGLHYFKTQKYFEAHDAWEELWSDRGLQDRAFIQGLIQLAVAIVHLENNNLNGARSMTKKALAKIDKYLGFVRGINVDNLKVQLNKFQNSIENISLYSELDLNIIPTINLE